VSRDCNDVTENDNLTISSERRFSSIVEKFHVIEISILYMI